MSSVEVENITKKFGDFIAVDNITFKVEKGEIFGFLGPNGAGKSTTIRILCGIISPTCGSGSVGGFPLGTNNREIKTIIGYMSQKFSLYDDLTVYENLDFYSGVYPIPRNERKNRIQNALIFSDLTLRQNDITATLPTGLKQRLALSCSLLHKPEILFLDEPTAGVDPLSRRNFWELIYKLSETGVTVFVTTHYMDEAEHCDRVAFIDGGKLVKIDSPRKLKMTAENIFEIECEDWKKGYEALRANEDKIGQVALFGTKIHITPMPGTEMIIDKILNTSGCGCISKQEISPSLEDIFVSLLRHD
ncbi:MAG: hypothetical protein B6D58_00145 [candidate division Zixibacteria bacterium 4484_95]|nr:MAG: hypothetical protein B6D58_00145 [candidate division Zixibacteria bacterium 4484_95]RKX18720.1 MAG: ABC transporter ATP-binding protein [candidate division Zixibacteria bacterium]